MNASKNNEKILIVLELIIFTSSVHQKDTISILDFLEKDPLRFGIIINYDNYQFHKIGISCLLLNQNIISDSLQKFLVTVLLSPIPLKEIDLVL